jgi:rhomboid protease GluP
MANIGLLVAPAMLLEARLGSARTLVVLGVSALAGGLLTTVGRPDSISLGSSAMGCGILGALAAVAWRAREDLPRGLVVLIAGVLTSILAVEQLLALLDPSFGIWGHVGGFFCGAALGPLMETDRRHRPGGSSRLVRLLAAVLVAVFVAAPLAAWRNIASGRACAVSVWGPWDEETHTEMLRVLRSYGAPCEIGSEALSP